MTKSTGMNKYVVEMPETMSSALETVNGASTGRSEAELEPKQTTQGTSSSGPQSKNETPIHEREWIEVEPEEYDARSFGVANKMNK